MFAEAAHGNWFASGICPKSTTLCVKTKVNLIENIAKSILNDRKAITMYIFKVKLF